MTKFRCRQMNSVVNSIYLGGQNTNFYKNFRLPTIPYFKILLRDILYSFGK